MAPNVPSCSIRTFCIDCGKKVLKYWSQCDVQRRETTEEKGTKRPRGRGKTGEQTDKVNFDESYREYLLTS